MNNIGVAALMLRWSSRLPGEPGFPASKLLMPLAYGCLLGD